jgi:hypothetical protein
MTDGTAPMLPLGGNALAAAGLAWHVVDVRWIVTLCLLTVGLAGCKRGPSPAEIADRGWRAHELVVAAGERAASCVEAGAAMQRVVAEHRQAFVDAVALDNDLEKLSEATDFIEAHKDRYADLETRMVTLSERCADDTAVQTAFTAMETP